MSHNVVTLDVDQNASLLQAKRLIEFTSPFYCCAQLWLDASVDIQASGISTSLSLLMLLGWSLRWIASFTHVLRSRAGSVQCCGCALKWWRSVSKQVTYPCCVPWFSPAEVSAILFRPSWLTRSTASFGFTSCDHRVVSDLKIVHSPCCCRQQQSCLERPVT